MTSVTAHKRKYPGDEVELEQAVEDSIELPETPSVSYAFKKPQIRVARRVSVSEDGDKNDLSSGHSKYPKRHRDTSRDDAQPLGRNKTWIPPHSMKNFRRGGRDVPPLSGQPLATSRTPESHFQENHESLASSNPNDETIPLSIPGECVDF